MKFIFAIILFLKIQFSLAQIAPYIWAGVNSHSAILPKVELNSNLQSLFSGDAVLKGVPQLAQINYGFIGGIGVKFNDRVGGTLLSVGYSENHLHKDLTVKNNNWLPGAYTYATLDRKFGLLHLFLDRNLALGYKRKFYFNMGTGSSFFIHYSGKETTNDFLWTASFGIGQKLGRILDFNIKPTLSINEMYSKSKIHLITIPVFVNVYLK